MHLFLLSPPSHAGWSCTSPYTLNLPEMQATMVWAFAAHINN